MISGEGDQDDTGEVHFDPSAHEELSGDLDVGISIKNLSKIYKQVCIVNA